MYSRILHIGKILFFFKLLKIAIFRQIIFLNYYILFIDILAIWYADRIKTTEGILYVPSLARRAVERK